MSLLILSLTFLPRCCHFGNPLEIVTDSGVQFTYLAFADFLANRNIKNACTFLYFPQANETVECMNCVLKDCVLTASLEGKPWKTSVRDFMLHYHATPHATTGVAPSELLLGHKLRTTLQILACVHTRQSQVTTYTHIKWVAKPSALNIVHVVQCRGKKGQDTYILDDRKVWNVMHLSPCPGQSHSDNDPTKVSMPVVTPVAQDSSESDTHQSGTKTLLHHLYTHSH